MKISEPVEQITTTQSNLARALNVTTPYISKLIKKGIVIRDPRDNQGGIMLFESLQNYYAARMAGGETTAEGIPDYQTERALHEAADRKMAELKLALAESRAYDARTVELVMTEQLSNLRTQLLGLPTKLAPMIENTSKEKIYEVLTREITEKLQELSEYEPELFQDEEYLAIPEDRRPEE